ncbi:hypothetical protein DL98DRAFT_602738 [Cadophora sp. DSE1049]|nr:hypothetical protein DL98DRAFT_602738 [Cadophora sp. DSE1049]
MNSPKRSSGGSSVLTNNPQFLFLLPIAVQCGPTQRCPEPTRTESFSRNEMRTERVRSAKHRRYNVCTARVAAAVKLLDGRSAWLMGVKEGNPRLNRYYHQKSRRCLAYWRRPDVVRFDSVRLLKRNIYEVQLISAARGEEVDGRGSMKLNEAGRWTLDVVEYWIFTTMR